MPETTAGGMEILSFNYSSTQIVRCVNANLSRVVEHILLKITMKSRHEKCNQKVLSKALAVLKHSTIACNFQQNLRAVALRATFVAWRVRAGRLSAGLGVCIRQEPPQHFIKHLSLPLTIMATFIQWGLAMNASTLSTKRLVHTFSTTIWKT